MLLIMRRFIVGFLVKKEKLVVLLFSVAVMIPALWPVIKGYVLLGDQSFFQLPYFNFYKQALNTGQSFLWNPLNANGFPAYASINGMFFPLHYLFFKYLPLITAFSSLFFLSSVFALFFTILFLKELGIGICASIIGGLSFVISEMYFFANITAVSYSLVFLPLLFIATLKLASFGRKVWLILSGGLVIGLAWLSIMPHFVLWIIMASTAFAIYLSFCEKSRKVLVGFILMNIIGGIIGVVQIWPTFWVAELSSRGAVIPYSQLSEHSIHLADLPRFFSPDFYNDLPVYASRDNATQGSEESLYVGAIPFLFLIASFFIRQVPFVKFFRWLFLACLVIGFKYSPFFWLITKVPILNSFRVPSRFMLLGSFASAVLVGLAVDFFINRNEFEKKSALTLLFIISASTTLITLAFIVYFRIVYVLNLPSISGKVLIPFLFLVAGYLSMKFFYESNYRKLALFVLVFFTIFDFILVFRSYSDFISLSIKENISTIDFLKDNPGKSIDLLNGEFQSFIYKNSSGGNLSDKFYLPNLFLGSNLNLLYGLESGNYYEKLLNRNTARLFGMVGVSAGEVFDEKKEIILPALEENDKLIKALKERRELFNFLGIDYIISGFDLSFLGMERVALYLVTTNIKNNMPINVAIFKNPNAKSLLYFVNKIDGFYSDDNKIFNEFSGSNFEGIFVECSVCGRNNFDGEGDIKIKEKENSFLVLETNSNTDQFLIFSENYYLGWEAYVDGSRRKIYKVNTVHMGLFLPMGKHEVVFKYRYYLPNWLNNIVKTEEI